MEMYEFGRMLAWLRNSLFVMRQGAAEKEAVINKSLGGAHQKYTLRKRVTKTALVSHTTHL